MRQSNRLGLFGTFSLTILGLLFLFPDWFQHPNSRVVEGYGDGYKAYHAILYHAKYDSTFSWYEGMNYPYGEHVVPGASQPLVSNGMKVFEALGFPVADYGWAVVHFSMLLGILLAALFTYLLLRRLGTGVLISLIGGLLITFMAPQLDRIIAHYGLAHPEVLPATLYFLRRWDEDPRWVKTLPVALCVALFSGIHFYYFAILAFLIGGWLAARWLLKMEWKRWWYYALSLALMFGLPAIGFYTWFGLTDPVVDRNEAPWGFFEFHSNPFGVFTSHTQPHWVWVREKMGYPYPGFEGWSYVGMVAILVLAIVLTTRAVRFARPLIASSASRPDFASLSRSLSPHPYLNALLLASGGILLFSFGLPLTKVGGAEWLEKMGPLRQFRSVGRFAWIFYYALSLWAWTEIDRWWASRSGGSTTTILRWPNLALLALILIAASEVFFFWRSKDFRLDEVAGLHAPTLAEQTQLDFEQYQAIIPVPYYNIGSDNFWWDQSGFIGQKVQTLSWQTGLSTNAAMLTRTSLAQTLRQLQFITEPYRPPQILGHFPNDKPFLLAVDTERYDQFGDRSIHLAKGEKLVYSDEPFQLYELPIDSWERRLCERYAEVYRSADSTAIPLDSLLRLGRLTYEGFNAEDGPLTGPAIRPLTLSCRREDTSQLENIDLRRQNAFSETAVLDQGTGGYAGTGYAGDLGEVNVLLDTLSGMQLDSGRYLLSFWMDIAHDRYARSTFQLQTRYGHQRIGPSFTGAVHHWVRVMDTNGWALVEMPIELPSSTTGLRLTLGMPLLKGSPLRVDDVLLRPAEVDVYRWVGETLWFNNRYYPPLVE